MPFDSEFESYWRDKVKRALKSHNAPKSLTFIEQNHGSKDTLGFTNELFKVMRQELPEEDIIEVSLSCACEYPKANLKGLRADFVEHKDIKRVHTILKNNFLNFLATLAISDESKQIIISGHWGAAGELMGNTIIATKIPKSGFIEQYFQAETPEQKRKTYCHCPRIREFISKYSGLDELYCYCGAGFYKGIWEYILGRHVEIKVLTSVLKGDEYCSFKLEL